MKIERSVFVEANAFPGNIRHDHRTTGITWPTDFNVVTRLNELTPTIFKDVQIPARIMINYGFRNWDCWGCICGARICLLSQGSVSPFGFKQVTGSTGQQSLPFIYSPSSSAAKRLSRFSNPLT